MVRSMHSICMTEHITSTWTGIHVCIFTTTFYLMSTSRAPKKFSIWIYLYLCVLFLIGTSQAIANMYLADEIYVTCRGLSGRDTSLLLIGTSDAVLVALESLSAIAVFL